MLTVFSYAKFSAEPSICNFLNNNVAQKRNLVEFFNVIDIALNLHSSKRNC